MPLLYLCLVGLLQFSYICSFAISMMVIFFISDIFLLVVNVVYQVLLVADLEIYPFAIAGKIEYVFVFCLGVLEVSGFLLADTGAIGSDEVTVYVIGYRQKLGTSDIYDLLADHKMYSKGIALN